MKTRSTIGAKIAKGSTFRDQIAPLLRLGGVALIDVIRERIDRKAKCPGHEFIMAENSFGWTCAHCGVGFDVDEIAAYCQGLQHGANGHQLVAREGAFRAPGEVDGIDPINCENQGLIE